VLYNGQHYPGRHRPLINQQLFDKVQEVMSSRNLIDERRPGVVSTIASSASVVPMFPVAGSTGCPNGSNGSNMLRTGAGAAVVGLKDRVAVQVRVKILHSAAGVSAVAPPGSERLRCRASFEPSRTARRVPRDLRALPAPRIRVITDTATAEKRPSWRLSISEHGSRTPRVRLTAYRPVYADDAKLIATQHRVIECLDKDKLMSISRNTSRAVIAGALALAAVAGFASPAMAGPLAAWDGASYTGTLLASSNLTYIDVVDDKVTSIKNGSANYYSAQYTSGLVGYTLFTMPPGQNIAALGGSQNNVIDHFIR
jgi:hypothetical protein